MTRKPLAVWEWLGLLGISAFSVFIFWILLNLLAPIAGKGAP
jgi:hypothetical protein